MDTSPSDKGGVRSDSKESDRHRSAFKESQPHVVRKKPFPLVNKVNVNEEEKDNTVMNEMNSREFTGEAREATALPSQGSEPSHEKQESDNEVNKAPKEPLSDTQSEQKPIHQKTETAPMPVKPVLVTPKVTTPQDVRMWLSRHGWKQDPFTFSIEPDLLVGYIEQTNQILRMIEEKHKLLLVVGPTGSGKTTILKWAAKHLPQNFVSIFIAKPPASVAEFVDVFNEKFQIPWYRRPFSSHIKNIYQLPEFLKEQTKGKHVVIMVDEIHEAKPDVLEWLRVLTDNVDNMSLIVAGLPVFNDIVKEKLETFQKRIISRIELLSLTKKETVEMIQKRIAHVGGTDISPFTDSIMDYIFNQTGGFPREVLRVCDELLNLAIKLNVDSLTKEMIDTYLGAPKYRVPRPAPSPESSPESAIDMEEEAAEEEYRPVSLNILEDMTPLQMRILNMLAEKESTPGEIADTFDLGKYKSRQHAVRSVNNILIRLMQEDLVRRNRRGRTFTYGLSPRIKTLLVRR